MIDQFLNKIEEFMDAHAQDSLIMVGNTNIDVFHNPQYPYIHNWLLQSFSQDY